MCIAAPAAADSVRDDLAREILRRVPEWPQAQVEIPIPVYEMFVRDALLGPTPPKPPEAAWLERAAWTLLADDSDEAVVEAALDVTALPGRLARHVKLLPTAVVWRDVAIDGKPAELRRGDDGWFWLDPSAPGRYRVTARATMKAERLGVQRRLAWATPPAGWTTGAAESNAAWEVRFSRAAAAIIGGEAGTRGSVGLVPGARLDVTWQKPQPLVHRAAQIESVAQVGWTLAEGVHQVRAVVDLRLWGGEVQELAVALPQGADRVSITGPDVREVQSAGGAARVFLRGPITQRTRLAVTFEVPRAKTGRMALPAFSIQGASARGGTLAIGGGAGAVLLEIESPGLQPMALYDLPDAVRGLLAAPVVYAYQAGAGAWNAQVDVVDMAEFPVRETLVDSALYTVLYRPDGHIMTKVTYEVRNRGQQYMKVDLPPASQLLLARVAEQQKNLARGPGDTVFVPLEKSVLTTAGLVSFPVELVYATKGPPLERAGRLRLPLPRTDLPVAYARCAVSVPEGLQVRRWEGLLREVPSWSNETAEMEFEYGHGHLAAGLKAPEPKAKPTPVAKAPSAKPEGKPVGGEKPVLSTVPIISNLFEAARPAKPPTPPAAQEPQPQPEDAQKTFNDYRLDPQALILQGKNSYRAGNDFYNRGDYDRARQHFSKAIEVAPNSVEAENARKFLGNIEIALGKQAKGKEEDRSLQAATKAVQMAQQDANFELRGRQQDWLQQAEQAVKAGNETDAEAAYKLALSLSGKLQARGEEAKEQEAVVRKAKEFIQNREWERKAAAQEVEKLQQQVQSLKKSIAQDGGRDVGVTTYEVTDLAVAAPGIKMQSLAEGVDKNAGSLAIANGVVAGLAQGGAAGRPSHSTAQAPAAAGERTDRFSGAELGTTAALAPAASVTEAPQLRSAAPAPQVELGEAIAEQQLAARAGRSYKGVVSGGGNIAFDTVDDSSGLSTRVEQLKKQVDELKSVKEKRERQPADVDGGWRAETLSRSSVRAAGVSDLGRKVAEKSREISSRADKATELARQGRIEEAQHMLADLEKDEKAVARDAAALGKTGAGTLVLKGGAVWGIGGVGGGIAAPEGADQPRAPAAAATAAITNVDGSGQVLVKTGTGTATLAGEAAPAHEYTAAPAGADQPKPREDPTRFGDFRTPSSVEPQVVAENRRKLEEARQAVANTARNLGTVNFSVAGIAQGKDEEKKLADYVKSNYGWALQASATGGGQVTGRGVVSTPPTVQMTNGQDVNTLTLSGANTYTGAVTFSGGTLTVGGTVVQAGNANVPAPQGQNSWFDSNGAAVTTNATGAQVTINAGDGTLAVTNDATAAGNVAAVLNRLRTNLGQSVALASRNIFVDPGAARAAGIEWKNGANGVTYAVLDEGQLLSLMDIEQRVSNDAKAVVPQGDVRQDTVVGTPAALPNGATVNIARALDRANTYSYIGNDVTVGHDDYFLVNNGGYLTAVKSARMRHWTAEPEPVRFPGVPAAVTVPVVGRTVKFEKTLVDASDTLELVVDYSWQGDEK